MHIIIGHCPLKHFIHVNNKKHDGDNIVNVYISDSIVIKFWCSPLLFHDTDSHFRRKLNRRGNSVIFVPFEWDITLQKNCLLIDKAKKIDQQDIVHIRKLYEEILITKKENTVDKLGILTQKAQV